MNGQATDTAVRKTLVVNASQARAFDVFTGSIATWWPRGHHLVGGDIVSMELEPRAGGHIVERNADGRECRWARVLVYEPPQRLVFTWDITPQWQLETDASKCSEVEVTFVAEAADRTRVELEHRHLERHGAGWEQKRDGVAGPNGWPVILAAFAEAVAG